MKSLDHRLKVSLLGPTMALLLQSIERTAFPRFTVAGATGQNSVGGNCPTCSDHALLVGNPSFIATLLQEGGIAMKCIMSLTGLCCFWSSRLYILKDDDRDTRAEHSLVVIVVADTGRKRTEIKTLPRL